MASLLRTRLVPRLTHLVVVSRPLVARPMMALVKSEQQAIMANQMNEIVSTLEEKCEQLSELQQQVQELEEENARLRARVGDDSDDDNEVSGNKIDRDSIEEKLEELEEKLDEAKGIVDDIRELLQ
jgi:septal ring factor EnvC (AmiA/AmiB activator)